MDVQCPELDELLAQRRPTAVDAHLIGCEACRGALALAHVRAGLVAPLVGCAEAELLLALGVRGPLGSADAARLALHVARCRGCRALARG